jgi:hypothetical protein
MSEISTQRRSEADSLYFQGFAGFFIVMLIVFTLSMIALYS